MKKLLSTLFVLAVFSLIYVQAQSNSSNMQLNNLKIDTAFVVQKTDSLAVSILKTFDMNSMRQSGVPLSIEHYDKTISYNADQNNALVSYSFNKMKFYGPTGSGIIIKEDKYPYRFDIIHDLKENNTYRRY